jgi:hypothetical protein
LRLLRVDAATGRPPRGSSRAVIAEAFLPGTEPNRPSLDAAAGEDDPFAAAPRAPARAAPTGTSGLY